MADRPNHIIFMVINWGFLSGLLLTKHIKTRLTFVVIIFVLFSGMDGLGSFIGNIINSTHSSPLWPPITHLEWWAHFVQLSSNTTQLYWVYNQVIPIWLFVSLYKASLSHQNIYLFWSLTFFLAPIPAIGFLPFLVVDIYRHYVKPFLIKVIQKSDLQYTISNNTNDLRTKSSPENILICFIVSCVTVIFFTANHTLKKFSIIHLSTSQLIIYIVFTLIEWAFLWLLLSNKMIKTPSWWLVGIILFISPIITIGNGPDFGMRFTIPSIFLLMLMVIRSLNNNLDSTRKCNRLIKEYLKR